jgi:hypothetical protein
VVLGNFFTPASQKKSAPAPVTWRVLGAGVIIGKHAPENYEGVALPEKDRRVAAFDLVRTLL